MERYKPEDGIRRDWSLVKGQVHALAYRMFTGHETHVEDTPEKGVVLRVRPPLGEDLDAVRIGRFTCGILERLFNHSHVSVRFDRDEREVIWEIPGHPTKLAHEIGRPQSW